MTTNGIAGGGFEAAKPSATTPWNNNEQYAAAPDKNFSPTDKSSQDGAGLGNNGK
jgi:hypothetical protein